jgi:hypothetical protein
MKRLVLPAILMLSAAAPALASPPPKPEPQPAPAAEVPADAPLEALFVDGDATEDRTRMLLRCVGPPPPKFPRELAQAPKTEPMSEPAVIADAPG